MKTEQQRNTNEFNVEAACVQVFSMVTASVSHEIKNVLAIINENGGLLEDLILMGGPDQGVPPEHVKSATITISRQVDRANLIMKNCNRLAHLGDKQLSQEPLSEIVELMAALAGRQADMKHMSITVQCPPETQITAPMLPFASLIYLLLRAVIDASDNESSITLSAQQAGDMITLSCNANLDETALMDIAGLPGIEATVRRVQGTLDVQEGMLSIGFSSDIS